MKKLILITFGILLMTTSVYADVFVVKSYKHEATNLAARVHPRKDNNDENCGLILVRTSILNLGILANTGVVGQINFKEGDYWVYVSPGTRRISFYKQGFVRLDYDLPTPVKSGETYILNLRYRRTDNSSAANKMGFVVINSQPTGADVYINDSATGMQTPFQNPYPEGYYRFKLKKPLYLDTTASFEIHPGKTTQLNINLSPNYGSFTISTTPEIKARVTIDGEDKGTTPVTVKRLPPGKHTLHLNKEMYLPWQSSFTISRGKNTQRTITMKANFGTVTVNAHKGDAIYIDNQQVGTGSYSGRLLKGVHIIRVEHKNYYAQSKQIQVAPGNNSDQNFNLMPKTGILSVMTTPIGANIFIDDKPKGQSPKFIDSLIVGTYTVKLEKQGYAPVEKQVEITENQTATIKETFSKLSKNLFAPKKNQTTTKKETSVLYNDLVKLKRRRNVWLISTLLTAGTGTYSYFRANTLYSQYQTATFNATNLHHQINTLDNITPVALGAAGFCAIEYIIHVAKCSKLKKKIKLYPSYSKNSGSLSLSYNF